MAVLVLLAVATDPWHHLFIASGRHDERGRLLGLRYGPLFWVHATWCYGVLAAAAARLARAWWGGSATVRRQVGSLLLAFGIPLVGNAVVLARPDLLRGQDVTPLLFTVTALVQARAVLRGDLLRVVPVARAAVLDTVPDIVVVVDAGGTVVDVNPVGRAYLRAGRPELPADPVGVPAQSFLSPRALGDLPGGRRRYALEYAPGLHLDIHVAAIHDRRGRSLGRVVVARDITDLVLTQRRLEEQVELVERLRAQLQDDSERDPLTGLHNRRFLAPALTAALERAGDEGTAVGVLVLDIDHFKRVNDDHGHAAGDAVLVAVAAALQAHVRAQDTVARTGGEEFVVVLPGAGAEVLAARAEVLRAACARLAVDVGGSAPVRPTVSVGTALHPGGGERGAAGGADLLAGADRALYAAKAAGRDRVIAGGG